MLTRPPVAHQRCFPLTLRARNEDHHATDTQLSAPTAYIRKVSLMPRFVRNKTVRHVHNGSRLCCATCMRQAYRSIHVNVYIINCALSWSTNRWRSSLKVYLGQLLLTVICVLLTKSLTHTLLWAVFGVVSCQTSHPPSCAPERRVVCEHKSHRRSLQYVNFQRRLYRACTTQTHTETNKLDSPTHGQPARH